MYRDTIKEIHFTGIDMVEQKAKSESVILAVIFAGYLVFNGILLAGHELWRDEANVWLMARELSPLRLLAEIKYQGHPCLWYFLVMPFAKAGLPFQTICVLSFAVMAVCGGVFLWKAPFHPVLRAVVLLSPIFTYFYSIIARNYCLIALCLVLLALYYPKRNEKCILYGLLLGLLVQADTIAIAPAGMIALMWLWENIGSSIRQKSFEPVFHILKGIWIPLASLLLWILEFYQVSDSPEFQVRIVGIREIPRELLNDMGRMFVRMTGWSGQTGLLFAGLFFLLALLLGIKLKNGWPAAAAILSLVFLAAFSAMIYQLHIWHYISTCFILIWMLWVFGIQIRQRPPEGGAGVRAVFGCLQVLLLVLAVSMMAEWNSEQETSNLQNALHGSYSDGKYAAEFIRGNIDADEVIISTNVPMASTVLAYLPGYEFYFAGSGELTSYADWSGKQGMIISLEELQSWGANTFPQKGEFYLLETQGSCLYDAEALDTYEILYQTGTKTARGEEYIVYRIPIRQ